MAESDSPQSSGELAKLPTIEVTAEEEYDIIEESEQLEIAGSIADADEKEGEQCDEKEEASEREDVNHEPPEDDEADSNEEVAQVDVVQKVEERKNEQVEIHKEDVVQQVEDEQVEIQEEDQEKAGEDEDNDPEEGEAVDDGAAEIDDVDINLVNDDEDVDDHIHPSAPSISLMEGEEVDHSVDTILEEESNENAGVVDVEVVEEDESTKIDEVNEVVDKDEETEELDETSDPVPVRISSPCPCDDKEVEENKRAAEELKDVTDGECKAGKIRLLFFRQPEDDILHVKIFRVDQMPSIKEGGSKAISIHLCMKPASTQRYKTRMRPVSNARYDEIYEFGKMTNDSMESFTLRLRAYGKCKKIVSEAHIPLSMIKDFQYQEVWCYFTPFDKKKCKSKSSEPPTVRRWYFAKNDD